LYYFIIYKDFCEYLLAFFIKKTESGTEIGNSLEYDFVVPPPHSWVWWNQRSRAQSTTASCSTIQRQL